MFLVAEPDSSWTWTLVDLDPCGLVDLDHRIANAIDEAPRIMSGLRAGRSVLETMR